VEGGATGSGWCHTGVKPLYSLPLAVFGGAGVSGVKSKKTKMEDIHGKPEV
jgi:hypothetical protein